MTNWEHDDFKILFIYKGWDDWMNTHLSVNIKILEFIKKTKLLKIFLRFFVLNFYFWLQSFNNYGPNILIIEVKEVVLKASNDKITTDCCHLLQSKFIWYCRFSKFSNGNFKFSHKLHSNNLIFSFIRNIIFTPLKSGFCVFCKFPNWNKHYSAFNFQKVILSFLIFFIS